MAALIFGIFALFWWVVFFHYFRRDRSRYRNCYLLLLAFLFTVPFLISISGPNFSTIAVVTAYAIMITLLIVPFFLIYNGVVMIRREGHQLAHLLSLILGIIILIGEIATARVTVYYAFTNIDVPLPELYRSAPFVAGSLISVSVIYGSLAFLIFMFYVLFLQIVPIKRDFDYVIILGAGLVDGERIGKLLRDRLDKAIKVYRKDPTPPKMIPSGGQGGDEKLAEAAAMKAYLLENGIPEEDILTEDRSTNTLQNLQYSKEILDGLEGRKYTALVTSNYHVYRALRHAKKVGLVCTGIGGHVTFYYWPSALIREFIAIHTEKKHLLLFLGGWLACMAAVLGWIYLAN
ncbi:MAG: YdcF family protein [Eubacterium sp.]|nr:YdcF family protein [Eubacterium sp.]